LLLDGLRGTSATTTRRSPLHIGRPRIDLTPRLRLTAPFFLGDFVGADGSPSPICPRQTLKRVLERSAKLGFTPMAGVEFEWFNFAETPQSWAAKKGVGPATITPGMFGYSLLRMADNRGFFNALMDDMAAFKVPIEGLHTETGPGVYEVAIAFSEALEAADRAILFKTGAKEIGKRFGVMPSFMAKWSRSTLAARAHRRASSTRMAA
jgi:glutamine synthetase